MLAFRTVLYYSSFIGIVLNILIGANKMKYILISAVLLGLTVTSAQAKPCRSGIETAKDLVLISQSDSLKNRYFEAATHLKEKIDEYKDTGDVAAQKLHEFELKSFKHNWQRVIALGGLSFEANQRVIGDEYCWDKNGK